ncbi:nucleotide exchange factor GrpE [Pontibacillus marinus]|uniref:Protein GrpE n=1 Tax=Pontibacillus marinus BH030004 = DSM 16465 TaxID=1385511 RepID=A0A0A5HJA4_9BACI|nr:nucleotide exchange factor GrpE [Pontibacillus marinus]KGX83732.1 heat shock protein GrpE [Pontibacillus marinus BH030004 = DSM 16465]
MDENKQQSEEMNQTEDQQEEVVENPEVEILEEEQENQDNQEDAEKAQLQQEKDEYQQRLLRLQADYDNFRRRTQKERENDKKYRSQDLINELLPVLDNFERALQVEVKEDSAQNFVEGMNMVYRQLKDALTKEGVEEIPAQGEPFDPHMHQAVMQVEDENYDSNVVVEELQKGYKLKDRVIRPAMVKVNQ